MQCECEHPCPRLGENSDASVQLARRVPAASRAQGTGHNRAQGTAPITRNLCHPPLEQPAGTGPRESRMHRAATRGVQTHGEVLLVWQLFLHHTLVLGTTLRLALDQTQCRDTSSVHAGRMIDLSIGRVGRIYLPVPARNLSDRLVILHGLQPRRRRDGQRALATEHSADDAQVWPIRTGTSPSREMQARGAVEEEGRRGERSINDGCTGGFANGARVRRAGSCRRLVSHE